MVDLIPQSVRVDADSLANHLSNLSQDDVVELVLTGDLATEAIADEDLRRAAIEAYSEQEAQSWAPYLEAQRELEQVEE